MSRRTTSREPSTAEGQNLRAWYIGEGIDDAVRAVLDTPMRISNETVTIWDTIDSPDIRAYAEGAGGARVIQAVQAAVEGRGLDQSQQTELFTILKWSFKCYVCHRLGMAADFANTPYILHGPTPEQPRLRSGPCQGCQTLLSRQEEARRRPFDSYPDNYRW